MSLDLHDQRELKDKTTYDGYQREVPVIIPGADRSFEAYT